MKNKIMIALSSILLLTSGVVYAATDVTQTSVVKPATVQDEHAPGYGPGGRRHRRLAARIARRLDLTEAQKEQIKAIHQAEKQTIKPLLDQLQAIHRQLRAMTGSEPFNEAQVRALAEQKAKVIAELTVARERIKSKVMAVLTPEQRAKLNQMRERARERFLRHLSN
ncbi:MAG: Spy/CpxP family protein refolding chaperone [Acidobacteriota bacterium]|nr:Spy/CpxP family protein refolding chaperone [Blastocatellia bacterium]MDW8238023.1 Spy/CpxP family protein refolding chaperone [Acidobacteriota bacterium]